MKNIFFIFAMTLFTLTCFTGQARAEEFFQPLRLDLQQALAKKAGSVEFQQEEKSFTNDGQAYYYQVPFPAAEKMRVFFTNPHKNKIGNQDFSGKLLYLGIQYRFDK
jgi:hypothetical protein